MQCVPAQCPFALADTCTTQTVTLKVKSIGLGAVYMVLIADDEHSAHAVG